MAERRVVYRLDYRTESVQKGTKKVDSALKKTDAQFKKSGKQVKDLTTHHKKLSDAQKKTSRAFTTTGKQVKTTTAGFNKLGGTISNTKNLMAQLGVAFSAAIIIRGLKNATAAATEFLEKVSDVYTLSAFKDAPELIGTYEKELRAIRLRVPFMELNTLTEATYKYISATGDAAGAMEITEKVAMTAAGNQAEAAVVMDVLNKSYANFGLTANDSTDILDKFSVAVDNADATGADLAENFGRMAASADALGWSIDETMTAFAIGTRALKSEEVATGFSAIYSAAIINADAFREWGIATDDLGTMLESIKAAGMTEEEMAELFPNVRAVKLINVLLKQTEEYEKALGEVENASGRFSEKFDEKMSSNSAKMVKFNALIDEAKIGLGTTLVDAFGNATIASDKMSEAVEEADNELLTAAKDAAAWGAGLLWLPGAFARIDEITGAIGNQIKIVKSLITGYNDLDEAASLAWKNMLAMIAGETMEMGRAAGEMGDRLNKKVQRGFAVYTAGLGTGIEKEKLLFRVRAAMREDEWVEFQKQLKARELLAAAEGRLPGDKKPPAGAGAPTLVREKTPEEEIADAIRVIDEKLAREKAGDEELFAQRKVYNEELIMNDIEMRIEATKAEEEARLESLKTAGEFFSDTLVMAVEGGDVFGAFKSLFLDRLGGIFSNMITGALGGIGGGGIFGALFSWLPFEKGGAFDPIHAQRGQIFKPRPGGYNVVLGESSTGGEAVTPFNNYGKELLRDYVIPKHFPELMSPAAYAGGGGGGTQSVNVEAAPVTVVVDGLDPRSLRVKQAVDRGSRAKAAVAG